MRNALSLVAIAILALLMAACSEDDSPVAPAAPVFTPDYFVNADTGDDANPGTAGEPWATITHALATAEAGKAISVAPGTYSAAGGEVFPIHMKDGQELLGDVGAKGAGDTPTRIQGEGVYALGQLDGAAIVGAEGARIAGFTLIGTSNQNFYVCVAVDGVAMEIDHNTFPVGTYGGVNSGNGAGPDIHDNLFQTVTYSLFMDGSTNAHVHNNVMEGHTGIRIFGSADCVFENNTIATDNVGIHAGSGTLTIRNNTFVNPSGYGSLGAILNDSGSPVIRHNTFAGGPAIHTRTSGAPDAGTSADPGNNDFSAIGSVAFRHTSSGTAYAAGNTWAHTPPTIGGAGTTDIVVTGSGTVVIE